MKSILPTVLTFVNVTSHVSGAADGNSLHVNAAVVALRHLQSYATPVTPFQLDGPQNSLFGERKLVESRQQGVGHRFVGYPEGLFVCSDVRVCLKNLSLL